MQERRNRPGYPTLAEPIAINRVVLSCAKNSLTSDVSKNFWFNICYTIAAAALSMVQGSKQYADVLCKTLIVATLNYFLIAS